ncbi:MAG: efflux RND transporter permease subunit [Rhodospirillaceae bacterium]|nr:efflux RND transporter permease subunit [Rhodospirillaceae bacterium]
MNLIRIALDRPVMVVAGVLMIIMFGFVALQQIPIQLTPDVRKPNLTITTLWPGAAPAEVEREILNRQEEVLRGLEGVERIVSTASTGRSRITLEFRIGQKMDRANLQVSNRLDRVTGYPDEVKRPQIATQGSEDNPIAWFVITRAEGNNRAINTYGDFVRDFVIERIERLNGVSGTNFYGGSEKELRVIVKPNEMAKYGLTVPAVVAALRRANISLSAGEVNEGKRRYVVRIEGELTAASAIRRVLVRTIEDEATGRVGRVTVGDIADVRFGYKDPTSSIRASGQPALVFNALRDTGANVIQVMQRVRDEVRELNQTVLKPAGLLAEQVYDETDYIHSAIDLVTQNIWVGGLLAALILLLFLRSPRATLVISLAIPVSVIGAFVMMAALGRSINVISLAGIAFAVGMVVDAAIVVLENIYRLKEQGKPIRQAAYEGASQVWGAVLVSALTTVMVFITILVLELEVGQLFRDIAVAISVSVILSLLVAVTLIPTMSNWMLSSTKRSRMASNAGGGAERLEDATKRLPLPGIDHLARSFTWIILGFTKMVVSYRILAILVVCAVCGCATFATWKLLPKLEYLPTGNRNLVLALSLPPPGYNLDTVTEIARQVETDLARYLAKGGGVVRGKPPEEPGLWEKAQVALGLKERSKTGEGPPQISRFFFVARNSMTIAGGAAVDPSRAGELVPIIQQAMQKEPGTFGRTFQPSLFGRGIGGGRIINFDISGPDLDKNLQVALQAFFIINRFLPRSEGTQVRPRPGLSLGAPEVQIVPNRTRLDEAGISARDLATTIDAFNDGVRVAEVTVSGRRTDMMLTGPKKVIKTTQGIESIPVVTPLGKIVPVRSLATVKVTSGATEIRHTERTRTVTLEISPSKAIALEAAMDVLREKVIPELEKGNLPPGVKISLSGEADQLTKTWNALVWQLLMALVIVYLVMAILFESFLYPLIIIFSVPLATAGGVLGLALLNEYVQQPLDMLTMLGFVILIGTVVNNAILLVAQTLNLARSYGMDPGVAIMEATRNRMRPIFMSTATSVIGMAPLVLFPGAGSELYRGLGSVVLGGLALSAVLTLLIIPPLMSLAAPTFRPKDVVPAESVPIPAE